MVSRSCARTSGDMREHRIDIEAQNGTDAEKRDFAAFGQSIDCKRVDAEELGESRSGLDPPGPGSNGSVGHRTHLPHWFWRRREASAARVIPVRPIP